MSISSFMWEFSKKNRFWCSDRSFWHFNILFVFNSTFSHVFRPSLHGTIPKPHFAPLSLTVPLLRYRVVLMRSASWRSCHKCTSSVRVFLKREFCAAIKNLSNFDLLFFNFIKNYFLYREAAQIICAFWFIKQMEKIKKLEKNFKKKIPFRYLFPQFLFHFPMKFYSIGKISCHQTMLVNMYALTTGNARLFPRWIIWIGKKWKSFFERCVNPTPSVNNGL